MEQPTEGMLDVGTLVADRYRIEQVLGRGGMAVAYGVHDTLTDRKLALKRLLPRGGIVDHKSATLFEQEFLTLQQLCHPYVVKVCDFWREADGSAFYTMEWLQGGALRERSPLPYQRVCALMSEVASALSLLHSRRLVHRDLTPRNVHCTTDGHAKLIDFGAIVPFGPAPHLVGTPPFCAPEAVTYQDLDGRADLFALGATAYFALTGRFAFRARTFDDLPRVWQTAPVPPSRYVSDIPRSLDALVLSLLARDPEARPASAAEVMERLCAIADLDMTEGLVVQQAYLTTPRLVGRDGELKRVRELLQRNQGERGGAIVVVGEEGLGRTRFLSQCALDATLMGTVVGSANALDAHGELAAALTLARQLALTLPGAVSTLPEAERALLREHLPTRNSDSLAPVEPPTAEIPASALPDLQGALRSFFCAASHERPLLLTIDDAEHIDERSGALLGLLSHDARTHRMVLVAALRHEQSSVVADERPHLRFFTHVATAVKLRRLTADDTAELLRSMFGDVAHLQLLIERLCAVACGSPAALMQLARHLVDRGAVRYEAGAWTLPGQLDPGDLPESVQATLRAQIADLSDAPLAVARFLSLAAQVGLSLDCLQLALDVDAPREAMVAVASLVQRGVVRQAGANYRMASESLRELVRASIEPSAARKLHLRLADVFEERGHVNWQRIEHLMLAGEPARALALVLETGQSTQLKPEATVAAARTLPHDWHKHLRALLTYAEQSGRPAREAHLVRMVMMGYAITHGEMDREDVDAVLAPLSHACGRDLYDTLDPNLPVLERAFKALTLANERYERTPDHERIMPPREALPLLARNVIRAIGVMGPRQDYAFFRDLTHLEPFATLSPALQVVQWNVEGTRAIASGRYHILLDRNAAMLARMAEPDRAGLDPVAHRYMGLALMYSTSLMRSMIGLQPHPEHLKSMDGDPLFAANAQYLRMLVALANGDIRAADQFKHAAELLRLRDCPPQMFEGAYLIREAGVYAFARDLTRLKQLLPAIERAAQRIPGWRPVHCWAHGNYLVLRDSMAEACECFEQGLREMRPGEHAFHAALGANYVQALAKQGELDRAVSWGEEVLAETRKVDLGPQIHMLLDAMARVRAEAGAHGPAVELADEALTMLTELGAGGLVLGGAHETRAWVALKAGDQAAFERHARACAAIYRSAGGALLSARYRELMDAASSVRIEVSEELADAAAAELAKTMAELSLSQVADRGTRARAALQVLVRTTGAEGGMMYTLQPDGPELSAQDGTVPPLGGLDRLVSEYLEAELGSFDAATVTCAAATSEAERSLAFMEALGESRLTPMLLTHGDKENPSVTGVVLLRGADHIVAPRRLLTTISTSLHDAGDVMTQQGVLH